MTTLDLQDVAAKPKRGKTTMADLPVRHIVLTLDNIQKAILSPTGEELVLPFGRADSILSEYYAAGYTLKYVQNLGSPEYADGTRKAVKLVYVLAK